MMSAVEIQTYEDGPAARQRLAGYLAGAMAESYTEADWQRRFAHWWDENPQAGLHPARGWVVTAGARLAGFLGVIPVAYSVSGVKAPALAASTWVIDDDCRHVSLPMFMKLSRLGKETMIVDTTPSPEVQALMDRSGWRAEKVVRRSYFLTVPGLRGKWPVLADGLRLVTDLAEVTGISEREVPIEGITKWVDVAALKWQMASPVRTMRWLGVVDGEGRLSSYLIMTHQLMKGLPKWAVVEAWTARATAEELLAMTGAWLTGKVKTVLPRRLLLSVPEFPPAAMWGEAPALHVREQDVCHYFKLPAAMANLPKRTVMAEGDLGL